MQTWLLQSSDVDMRAHSCCLIAAREAYTPAVQMRYSMQMRHSMHAGV